MSEQDYTFRARPDLWLIRLIGVIVPRRLRAHWRQEWEAELHRREALLAEWDRLNSISCGEALARFVMPSGCKLIGGRTR